MCQIFLFYISLNSEERMRITSCIGGPPIPLSLSHDPSYTHLLNACFVIGLDTSLGNHHAVGETFHWPFALIVIACGRSLYTDTGV
uniref:Uncharacterized protein n=1 Tax=Pyxicephalus adspersus TaxID=30357 RepID=A0AAV3AE27_PYXAD|nr:TPA: hypothetical protein GDO54_009773 [Pyxicephalus adspersus]